MSLPEGRTASEPSEGRRVGRLDQQSQEDDCSGRKWVQLSAATHATLKELSGSAGRPLEEVLDDLVHQQANQRLCPTQRPKATYEPKPALREKAIEYRETVLLFIDVQNFNCHPDGALYSGPDVQESKYWWERLNETQPVWKLLRERCQRAGIQTVYTVIQALTPSCKDISMDYQISGFKVPPGSFDSEVLDCIKPGPEDIVLPKSSCNVFTSTSLPYILRNLCTRYLILAGCLTDQCVESAVREAADRGFYVTLVSDACATMSEERHQNSLRTIKGFCRQRTLQQLDAEMDAIDSSRSQGLDL